jgi:acetylornithine deacetylase/succinyl-diaminopimelate desuccinylase-like protein
MQQQHVHNTCDMTKHCTIIACLQRLLILLPIILETNTTNVVAFAQPSSNTSPPSESPTTAATTDMLQSASRRVAMKVISPSVHRQRAVVQLAQELIRIPSITPKDLECQDVIRNRLEPLGFQCEAIKFEDVTNLWCVLESDRKNTPTTPPLVAFLGHTDVVPVGPQELWKYPPFDATVDEMGGILYGRGAVDMKGGIASFVVALQEFLAEQRQRHMVEDDTMESNSNNSTLSMSLPFSLGILLTSDEEGLAKWGTRAVLEELQRRGTKIDMVCVLQT